MRVLTCYYCSSPVYPGHGSTFIRNDAKSFVFCRHKCVAHFRQRHNPRRSRWTKASRKLAGKELCLDKVFEFERQRNTPVKYNRELYVKTVQAMKVLETIRQRRAQRYYLQRQRIASERHLEPMKHVLRKHHLVLRPLPASKVAVASVKQTYISEATRARMIQAMEEKPTDAVRQKAEQLNSSKIPAQMQLINNTP